MINRGLFIGRFQPFHKGHLTYIKLILGECRSLLIGIGSAEKQHTLDNPFSFHERREMLHGSLCAESLERRVTIFPLKDYPGNDDRWFREVMAKVPRFDVYFAGENQLTKIIFLEKGLRIKICKRIGGYKGTNIRKKMRNGRNWEEDVPKFVASYIKEKKLLKIF